MMGQGGETEAEKVTIPRRLPFEGAVNFRDLGGYPASGGRVTRWRRLFRSDSLAELTEADQDRLRGLGLRTLCDFRLPDEAARKPNRLPEGCDIATHAIGFIPEGTLEMLAAIGSGRQRAEDVAAEVLRHYTKFVDDHREDYARMFRLILSADALPMLIHCTSGKDRTGIGAAAVLMALGVPRDVIVRDYVLTNDYRRDIRHLFDAAVPDEVLHVLTTADPRYLAAALDAIDSRHGGPDRWLAGLGLTAADRGALRDRLTEAA